MQYFTSFEIAPGVTQIEDICLTKMYLVEGRDKAVLLDDGVGLGNIASYVRTLTDKPLLVIITHGHVDHAMGSGTFDREVPIYMSEMDRDIYLEHSQLDVRKGYFNATKDMVPAFRELKTDQLEWIETAPFDRFRKLSVGDTFDIGGEILEICPGAGHTKGCITVLLQNHRILLLGDCVNPGTFLFDDYSLPVSAFKETLKTLKATTDGRYDQVLFCHGEPGAPGFGDTNMIAGGIWLCDAILENRDMRIPTERMGKPCYLTKPFLSGDDIGDKSECNIIYSDYTLR